ncbi:MAG: 2-amino-4-hydroxy-6-hydroxymethyldihydropteridine diphosphokinase, partial [Burkholderiaceae bacterium]
LDLLLYGSEQIASATLTVPHPRLTERAFALLPLLQLDPFIAIPGAGPAHAFAPQVAQQAIRRL